ncbi:MAG: hypothetical protein RID91_13875, partial [Azospirillaceae bacterium]
MPPPAAFLIPAVAGSAGPAPVGPVTPVTDRPPGSTFREMLDARVARRDAERARERDDTPAAGPAADTARAEP